jgi:gluconolactonase
MNPPILPIPLLLDPTSLPSTLPARWADSELTKLTTGLRFTEGPVYVPATKSVIFSDIPANTLYRYDIAAKTLSEFRKPSDNANGNTLDAEGCLLTAHHGSRSITRTLHDGTVTTLATHYQGKRLNSPNDLITHPSGLILFTDPPYGLPKRTEGKEQPGDFLYSFDPRSGIVTCLNSDPAVGIPTGPNGLCFSPDCRKLYVAASLPPRGLWVFDVLFRQSDDGSPELTLAAGRELTPVTPGSPDGIRADVLGNIWLTAGDGVQIFNPDGHLLGKIPMPEAPANLCFAGPDLQDLYLTARTSLYHVRTTIPGVR